MQLVLVGMPTDIKLHVPAKDKFLSFRPVQRDLLLLTQLDVNDEGDDVIRFDLRCTTIYDTVSGAECH